MAFMRMRSTVLLASASSASALVLAIACTGSDPDPSPVITVNLDGGGGTSGNTGTSGGNVGTSSGGPSDGGSSGAINPGACKMDAPFDPPIEVVGLHMADTDEADPSLSDDELTIYFTRGAYDGFGDRNSVLVRATRDDKSAAFVAKEEITDPLAKYGFKNPSISGDQLHMVFQKTVGSRQRIYFAERPTPSAKWSFAEAMLSDSGSKIEVSFPKATRDGVYFSGLRDDDDRGDTDAVTRLYLAPYKTGALDTPAPVKGFDPSLAAGFVLTENGLRAYFQAPTTVTKRFDIMTVTRATTTSSWGTPVSVMPLNSAGDEYVGTVSPDGCRIYYTSTGDDPDASYKIYVASKPAH